MGEDLVAVALFILFLLGGSSLLLMFLYGYILPRRKARRERLAASAESGG